MTKVHRYTRAGKDGKLIICPECDKTLKVSHFSWSSLFCPHCKAEVDKGDWEVSILRGHSELIDKANGWEGHTFYKETD